MNKRVKSQVETRFRRWATQRLHEYIQKAEHEFAIYRQREMQQLESDFDKAIKELPK